MKDLPLQRKVPAAASGVSPPTRKSSRCTWEKANQPGRSMEAGKGSSRTIQPCEIIEIEDDPMDPLPGPSVPIPSQQAQTSQRVCNDKGVEVKMNTQSTQTSEATVLLFYIFIHCSVIYHFNLYDVFHL